MALCRDAVFPIQIRCGSVFGVLKDPKTYLSEIGTDPNVCAKKMLINA